MKFIFINRIPEGKTKLYVRYPARLHKRLGRKSSKNVMYLDLVEGTKLYALPKDIRQVSAIYFR